MPLSHL